MLVLNAADVRRALPMADAVQAMKDAFAALTEGRATVPPRAHVPITRNAGISLFMPAFVDGKSPDDQALTIKAVSLFDNNAARGLARIQATVLVLQPDTGQPIAVLEGATLTAIRTAAVCGAATDLLARDDSRVVAILGAGVQARSHVEAMCAVRPVESIRIYSRSPDKVASLIRELNSAGIDAALAHASTAAEAIDGADIVCCTTTSSTPVFHDDNISSGTHINAVGSYTPQAREVPAETVVRSRVIVDNYEAAWEEAGDLIQPLEAGEITKEHVAAELGELVLGRRPGRESVEQITFFKSVGVAVQDAFAAKVALARAATDGLGQRVDW